MRRLPPLVGDGFATKLSARATAAPRRSWGEGNGEGSVELASPEPTLPLLVDGGVGGPR